MGAWWGRRGVSLTPQQIHAWTKQEQMLPSFVPAQQWSWRALLRSRTSPRLPLGCSSKDAAATGKAKHPQKLETAWRELVAAKPSRKAWQERDWQAQGDVSFPICLALAPQGFAPLGRIYVGQGPSSGRAVALTSALNRESHSLGASPCESGHCRGFSTAAENF